MNYMKTIYFIRHGEGYHNLKSNNCDNYHLLYPRLTTKRNKPML